MERVVFEKYNGSDSTVVLAELPGGKEAAVIGAKAFLNCRTVHKLVLPETVTEVEDWGFAHMKSLEELVLPAKEMTFGRKVFLGCDKLQRIVPGDSENRCEGIPELLASAVIMGDTALLRPEEAGDPEGQWHWLEAYDALLLSYLRGSDDTGYEPGFVGWFNVEDVDDQKIRFMNERKKQKIALLFQRLIFDAGLSEENREQFAEYLLGKSVPEIPDLFLECCENPANRLAADVRVFETWQTLGGMAIWSPDVLLEHMPDGEPEVRAYLMGCVTENGDENSFFDDMEL